MRVRGSLIWQDRIRPYGGRGGFYREFYSKYESLIIIFFIESKAPAIPFCPVDCFLSRLCEGNLKGVTPCIFTVFSVVFSVPEISHLMGVVGFYSDKIPMRDGFPIDITCSFTSPGRAVEVNRASTFIGPSTSSIISWRGADIKGECTKFVASWSVSTSPVRGRHSTTCRGCRWIMGIIVLTYVPRPHTEIRIQGRPPCIRGVLGRSGPDNSPRLGENLPG